MDVSKSRIAVALAGGYGRARWGFWGRSKRAILQGRSLFAVIWPSMAGWRS